MYKERVQPLVTSAWLGPILYFTNLGVIALVPRKSTSLSDKCMVRTHAVFHKHKIVLELLPLYQERVQPLVTSAWLGPMQCFTNTTSGFLIFYKAPCLTILISVIKDGECVSHI